MPILKPKLKPQRSQQRINIDKNILDDVKLYCQFASLNKVDEFFEEAAIHILSKDKEFKEYKEGLNISDQEITNLPK